MSNALNIRFKTLNQGVHLMTVVNLEATTNLSAAEYQEFSQDLEFAGFSRRNKPLSVPGSKTPANFCGHPITLNTPSDEWVPYLKPGLLLNTATPNVCIFLRDGEVLLYVNKSNLIPRYNASIFKPDKLVLDFEVTVTLTLELYNQEQDITLFHGHDCIKVAVPDKTKLSRTQWASLNRHIFNGEESARFNETIPVIMRKDHAYYLWVPCALPNQIEDLYGIRGKPIAIYNNDLGFSEVTVVNAEKAAKVAEFLAFFGNKTIHFESGCHGFFFLHCVLNNPRLFNSLENIVINPQEHTIKVGHYQSNWNTIVSPLCGPVDSFCPKSLVPTFFVSYNRARKLFDLANIRKYSIQTSSADFEKERLVLKTDLDKLTPINQTTLRDNLESRKAKLEGAYGPLPKNWKTHSVEDIHKYFDIQKKVKSEELVALSECPVISPPNINVFYDWLKESKHGVYCKVSRKCFITNFKTVDQLMDVPGFWDVIQKITKDAGWFRSLLLSKEAQHKALAYSL